MYDKVDTVNIAKRLWGFSQPTGDGVYFAHEVRRVYLPSRGD